MLIGGAKSTIGRQEGLKNRSLNPKYSQNPLKRVFNACHF